MHKYNTQTLTQQIQNIISAVSFDNKNNNFEWYAKSFIQDSDPKEVSGFPPEILGTYIKMSLDFIQNRPFGKACVRVHTPVFSDKNITPYTVIDVINDDMPFLVDSVSQFLAEKDIDIISFFHPVCRIKRNKEGEFVAFSDIDGKYDGLNESVMQLHIAKLPDAESECAIQTKISDIMLEVRKATSDWHVMIRQLDNIMTDYSSNPVPVEQNHLSEVTGFLRWLSNNHFTFLGFREYHYDKKNGNKLKQIPDSGLGLFRDADYFVMRQDNDYVDIIDDLNQIGQNGQPITILKSNRKTNVHRFAHMDQIFVTIYDKGEAIGQYCFIGLFTSTAYNAQAKDIPLLRQKINDIITRSEFRPMGHDGKTLMHILETYPRDELFQADTNELYDIVMGIIKIDIRPNIRLFVRYDKFSRFVTALVYLPRERLNTDARNNIGALLSKSFGGRISTFSLWFSENNTVRIKYIIAVNRATLEHPDIQMLESEIKTLTANWRDSVREVLYNTITDGTASHLLSEYADIFPVSYRATHNAKKAVRDIKILETVKQKNDIVSHILVDKNDPTKVVFRLFSPNGALPLSDCLPVFENFGFRVLTENPHALNIKDKSYYLHEFTNQNTLVSDFNVADIKELIADAFLNVYHKRAENDGFNKLTLSAGLGVHQVAVLRAFARYLKQTDIPYSQHLISQCLVKHSKIALSLYEMFDVLHNPKHDLLVQHRQEKAHIIKQNILDALTQVSVLDEDNIINRMMNVIESVLRTNVFCNKDYLSFKLNCANLTGLPLPRPYREIWVYSTRIEGVHLRFGKVARGGLRWSDRQDDFRTEILGLVKAQQVKNAVIVPVGAKGGFFAKKLPDINIAGRDAWLQEGIESYKIFISALLDITDNIVSGTVVPPENVVRHDDDDPYLVVAADKGTATFSDIANGLSQERHFWLGDAFASGGSVGYDHKKMAITARGAWEAVKRHFREKGKDIQTQEFTVIGVGDMSGDVFGNGMLLSRKIKLMAAFDHRDIFIDPTPDTETSFAERERLFNLPRSSWQDYDKALISKGGGIFSRGTKSITLTPEIQNMTGLTEKSVTPAQLMTALLKSQTDLLWFGGIGTYIKSSTENNVQVGDKSNDSIRIDGNQLRALVVGEGANLALTQKGRIEFALAGGAINTDAVDNSAGVDCSDHEVNIKIALGHAITDGVLAVDKRNDLLVSMTDEVADLVLSTNYNQTLTLSVTQKSAPDRLQIHTRFLNYLEKHADLNRTVEHLPDDKTLMAGRGAFKGLTRPELSVVMAYSKLSLYKTILESTLPDDVFLQNVVKTYMPKPLGAFQSVLDTHPLRREIITTVITNRAINEGGITFIFRLCERLNVTPYQAMRGYLVARNIMGLDDLLDELAELDNKIPTTTQIALYEILRRTLFDQTRRILVGCGTDFNIQDTINIYAKPFQELLVKTNETLGDTLKTQFNEFVLKFEHPNLPVDLCKKICALYFMKNGCDAIDLTKISNKNALETTKLYFQVIEILGLDELRRKATEIPLSDIYDQKSLSQIITQMDMAMYNIVLLVATSGKTTNEWFEHKSDAMEKYQDVLRDAAAVNVLGLSRLSIIATSLNVFST